VALTAWEGLITRANVQPGQTVLICGATGGVGHIAIQLAKYKGAKVFALSSSSEKMDIAKKLGADIAINYQSTPLAACSATYADNNGFDIVFDTVGGENLSHCINAAAIFGQVISILAVGTYDLSPAFFKGLSLHTIMQPLPLITHIRRADYGTILSNISALVDTGHIKPIIDTRHFSIAQAGAAHQHLESGTAIGKVVLEARDWV
jgi:NADPH2:quinone reductase